MLQPREYIRHQLLFFLLLADELQLSQFTIFWRRVGTGTIPYPNKKPTGIRTCRGLGACSWCIVLTSCLLSHLQHKRGLMFTKLIVYYSHLHCGPALGSAFARNNEPQICTCYSNVFEMQHDGQNPPSLNWKETQPDNYCRLHAVSSLSNPQA